ncbi:MAG: hypothetical protein COA82_03650 [Alkaliphilus sp.]|nr:MAG: hypothetical protein COA82_03650 [Alkaliphilus sp.]
MVTRTYDREKSLSKRGVRDALGMPIHGYITNPKNIDLLKMTLDEEKRFNNPAIAYEWVANKYQENGQKYSKQLPDGTSIPIPMYEAERQLEFIDVDVFRQSALYFKEHECYTKFDEEYDSAAYRTYWDTVEYRKENGMTAWAGIDKNGNPRLVHCPAKLWGFMNLGPIVRVEDDDDALSNESDFKEDENTDPDLLAEFRIEELLASLNIRETELKKKKIDFPSFFDGQYHLVVAKSFARLIGKNFFFGKARRKGMSYFNAYDLWDDIDTHPEMSVILAAYDKKYLTTGKGLMKMVYTYSDWYNKHTDFYKNRLVTSKEHLKIGYTEKGDPVERGYKSEAIAVSAMNNPDVTIGKDVFQLAYEEMGKFPNWKECHEVTSSTAEAGDYKTGHICGWGTGGTEEANWEAFEDVYYNPNAYDNLACKNIWDKGLEDTACGYFYPHVESLEGHMNYNGNTNYKTSWASYKKKKQRKRLETTDETSFEKWCGQRANCGQEAFARSGTNIFNRDAIQKQLNRVMREPSMKYLSREGWLVRNTKGHVKLELNEVKKINGELFNPPVLDFPLRKDTRVHGCFIEYVPPYRDPITGLVPEGLYVAFQDPYAHDKDIKKLSTKDSIGVTFWYERINNITPSGGGMIVAEYCGRPPSLDTYNDQVMNGLFYYNCKLFFENDRGDVKPFMKARGLMNMLYDEPELLFVKELMSKSGRGKGMHLTDKRKARGAIYLRDRLNEVVGTNHSTGEDKLALEYIYSVGILKELLRWNMDGNFDRVSALIIGEFIIRELAHEEIQMPSPYDGDSFFEREQF